MTTLTPVKMTDAERDLVDWLMSQTGLLSRSAVVRSAVLDLARRMDAPREIMRRINLARLTARPRSAKKVVDLRTGRGREKKTTVGNT